MVNVVPWYSTGAAGMAVATSACPSDHAMMSDGIASIAAAGAEIEAISGRRVAWPMAWMTAWVNVPRTAEVPSRTVGATPSMMSMSLTGPGPDAQGESERFLA